jgi:hypothetical protein
MRKPLAMLGASALVLALSLFAFAAPSASAHAWSRVDTSGSITGALVNGTHGNAAIADTPITLQAVVLTRAKDVATATTDAQGRFHFAGLDTSGATTYAVYTHFQGGLFIAPEVRFDTGPAQTVTLSVYDVTASDVALHVVNATILVSKPNQPKGLLPIGEFVTFENRGNTAYVGTTAPANGLPMSLLRFSLPASATNLTLGAGFADTQVVQVATGFGAEATLPPGQSAFAFAFDMPYSGTAASFTYKAEYPSDHVVVLLQPNVRVAPRDFTATPAITASGQRYQVLARGSVAGNAQLTFGISGLPLPGEDPDLDFRLLALLGVVLLVALGGVLWMYLRRGTPVLSRPFAALRSTGKSQPRSVRRNPDNEQRLLAELLKLETRHDAGKIDDATYERRVAETRAQLRPLVIASEQQIVTRAPTSRGDAGAGEPVLRHAPRAESPDERRVTSGGSQ